MPVHSAGLLPYRFGDDRILEVLLVHPGGPFWANKDNGAWSIAKGEYEPGEDPREAANREFAEELGQEPPVGPRIDLGEIRQPSGKLVRVWAVEGDLDVENITSNVFEIEWPPHSGNRASWPEVDRASWMSADSAKRKLAKGQVGFVDGLVTRLRETSETSFSLGG
ncbi:MAG: NUDIX domain-containing protein [Acidimicrobiales bacterium]|jgi:predicted NUDIX family NTP pyrophosphohydrolase